MNQQSVVTSLRRIVLAAGLSFAALNAQAASVGVSTFGYPDAGYVSAGLTGFGHSVTGLSSFTTASLSGLDAVFFGRLDSSTADLTAFVAGGGILITEWSGAAYGMGLLGGAATDNYSSAITSDPVVFSPAGLGAGLGTGLGASYSDFGATEFFQDFGPLGSGTIYAVRGSSGATAIVGGAYGSGYVWVNGYDWADSGSTPTFQLLHNELNASPGAVPDGGATIALLGLALAGFVSLRSRFVRA